MTTSNPGYRWVWIPHKQSIITCPNCGDRYTLDSLSDMGHLRIVQVGNTTVADWKCQPKEGRMWNPQPE
jgi:hypothetical protein